LIEQIRNLAKLQEIDTIIEQCKTRIAEINNLAEAQRIESGKINEEIENVENVIIRVSKEQHQFESNLKLEENKYRKWEKRLPELKNTREYQVLTRELDFLKKERAECEENILQKMGDLEGLKEEKKDLQAKLTDIESQSEVKGVKILKEKQELERQVEDIEGHKEGYAKNIRPDLMSRYKRIAKIRQGLAVVGVWDEKCTGCNMRVPPQLYNKVQRLESIEVCPYCQRMLFFPPILEDN